VFANAVLLRVLGLAAVCVLLAAAAEPLSWLGPSLPAHLEYVLAIAALGSGRELLLAALQGIFAFGRYAGSVVFPAVLRLSGIAALFAAGRGELIDLLRLELGVLVVSLVVVLGLLPLPGLVRGWVVERGLVRQLLAFSAPLYANSIGYLLSTRLNLFLLAGLTDPVSVANYGAAGQVPDGFARIFQAMVVAYFPFASRLSDAADKRGATRLLAFALALAAFGNMVAVVIAALFGRELLTVLFGAKYGTATLVFVVLMASYCLQGLASVMGYSLVAAGHPGVTTSTNAVGIVLLLAGSLAAVPSFGAIGAAGALAGANAVTLLLNWQALRRRSLNVGSGVFLAPIVLGFVAVSLGHAIAIDSIGVRLAVVGLYMLICGALVKELRASIQFLASEARLLFRSRAATSSVAE
jgi:O-antigen/teichoic acid export membrane protein